MPASSAASGRILQPVVQLEVHVVVELNHVLGLAGHRELHVAAEGHGEVAVEALAVLRAHLQRQTPEVLRLGVAHAEEVTDRRLDARLALAVPVGAEDDLAQVVGAVAGNGHPYVGDDPGTGGLGDGDGLAGSDVKAVVVAAGAVVAGKPPGLCLAQLSKAAQR
jgi:hypothetical protein